MTIDDIITALENENAKLMNRIFDLEAEKEALIAGQETLQKHIAEKNAEIKRLTEENKKLKHEMSYMSNPYTIGDRHEMGG